MKMIRSVHRQMTNTSFYELPNWPRPQFFTRRFQRNSYYLLQSSEVIVAAWGSLSSVAALLAARFRIVTGDFWVYSCEFNVFVNLSSWIPQSGMWKDNYVNLDLTDFMLPAFRQALPN